MAKQSIIQTKKTIISNCTTLAATNPAKDGRMCLALRPGFFFRPLLEMDGSDARTFDVFMVVTNLKWAVLAWPVVLWSDLWILDPNGALSWHFAVRPDQYEAFDPQPSLKSNCGLGADVASASWEPMVRSMLRTRSSDVVMSELSLLAKYMNLDSNGWKTRADLVRLLACQVGGEEFATCVMEKEEKATKRGRPGNAEGDDTDEEDEAMDDLAELILGDMGADADDFREMKQRLQNRHAVKKKRQWAEWRKSSDEVFDL